MTKTTITGVRGSPLPNLESHGLGRAMKEAKKLIDEQARLRQRASELGTERQRLQEQIKKLENERTRAWGRALRSGGETPSDKEIEKAKKRVEAIREESAAVRHAGELSDAELKQAVAEHAEEYDALVQAKAEEILSEAQRMADALSAKLAETEGLVALHGWLTSGAQFYTRPTPVAISIDNVLRERRRELGLVAVGVIG
jgi:FKBP-type peptidyl-prolyl cis-trans isomerase